MEDIYGQTLRDIAGNCSWFEHAVTEEEKIGCTYCTNWDQGICPFYLRRRDHWQILLAE
jgi:hypothetical protein